MSFLSTLITRSKCLTSPGFIRATTSAHIFRGSTTRNYFRPATCCECTTLTSREKRHQNVFCANNVDLSTKLVAFNIIGSYSRPTVRSFSTSNVWLKEDEQDKVAKDDGSSVKKTGIVAKFKQIARDYWYVLVPVHMVTSAVWFGSFYVLCKSGVDVTALLSSCGVSEAYLVKIANSEWSYVALATACYKLATPARYTVTVGASTLTIKYLKDWGYLKTSGEVAKDFRKGAQQMREKMEVVEDKMKDKWDKYSESRRRRRKNRRARKSGKPKEN